MKMALAAACCAPASKVPVPLLLLVCIIAARFAVFVLSWRIMVEQVLAMSVYSWGRMWL